MINLMLHHEMSHYFLELYGIDRLEHIYVCIQKLFILMFIYYWYSSWIGQRQTQLQSLTLPWMGYHSCYVHTSGQINTTHSDPFCEFLLSRLIGVQVDWTVWKEYGPNPSDECHPLEDAPLTLDCRFTMGWPNTLDSDHFLGLQALFLVHLECLTFGFGPFSGVGGKEGVPKNILQV